MSAVDDAYARYGRLIGILDRAEGGALRQPASQQSQELGLLADTDRANVGRMKLKDAFRDMKLRIEYLGLLDPCASFEDAFRRRVATAIGEARKNVREHYNLPLLRSLGERLVRDARSFESLANILSAIEGFGANPDAVGIEHRAGRAQPRRTWNQSRTTAESHC